jgi:signal transduction histidine kinase
LLCGRGRHEAAIRLEEMWNELGHRRRFSLYCAYPLDLFTRAEHRAAFAQVCARHTHVLPPQGRWRHAGVSEHDLAIAQLQQKAAALELEVARRIEVEQALRREEAERATLLAELQAANRAKDEFLAMLGHELRNPLAPIVTSLHLMRGRADAQSRHAQAIIERQVNHLVCLVDDLLDISKITRGKIELRTERVTIADVVAKAVEMASVLIAQRRHRLLVELPDAGIEWVGDPVRLAQVVSNLLTNSARYTPNGGEVRVRVERDGDELVIAVRDNGRGIAPHMLSRVFDIFFQGGRGVDRAEGGLGIGLALVKSLVAMHGGQVAAHSEGVGRGSEFVVRLPLEPLAGIRAQAVQGASAAVVADGARRVMVVDDNADAADMLGLALQSQGHDVTVVHDPLAALDTAGRFRPDVAVLDIGLPVMDGYELAAQLRERCGTPRLIALTGYGQESDKRRSREAGFEAHLVKPVDLDRLCELLQTPPLDGSG